MVVPPRRMGRSQSSCPQRKLNRHVWAACLQIDPPFQRLAKLISEFAFCSRRSRPEIVAKPIIHSATKYIGQRAQEEIQPNGATWIADIRIDSMCHEDVAAGGTAFSWPRILGPFVGIISVAAKEAAWTYLSEKRG